MIELHIRCFAQVREAFKKSRLILVMEEGISVSQFLKTNVIQQAEQLEGLPLRVAVNQIYVDENHILQDGDEVALISPVSGG